MLIGSFEHDYVTNYSIPRPSKPYYKIVLSSLHSKHVVDMLYFT